MNVLHITGDSKWGGGGVVIEALIRQAIERGRKVDMLSTDPRCHAAMTTLGAGIVNIDVIWRDIKPLRDIKGLVELCLYLRRHRYDVVHTHTSKAGFVGRIAARLAGVPVVLHTVHGFAFHEQTPGQTVAFYSVLEKVAGWFCDAIVTVSHYHRDWAMRLHIASGDKLKSIPNGIAHSRLSSDPQGSSFRERIGASRDSLVVVTHGRLADGKGLEYLIQAIPDVLAHSTRPCKFVFVGDGPQRSMLEDLARTLGVSDSVVFDGYQSDIGSILAGSDIVALPTLREGLSIALLEAMAAGKPIVATGIGSNLEATDSGKCAIIVPTRNPRALAGAIKSLAAEPQKARTLAQAARSRFLSTYCESQMTDAYERLYRDLLSSKRPSIVAAEPSLTSEAQGQ